MIVAGAICTSSVWTHICSSAATRVSSVSGMLRVERVGGAGAECDLFGNGLLLGDASLAFQVPRFFAAFMSVRTFLSAVDSFGEQLPFRGCLRNAATRSPCALCIKPQVGMVSLYAPFTISSRCFCKLAGGGVVVISLQ